jgi:two-component system nitrate/nitrite response regulator NarL
VTASRSPIRIVIADPHPILRDGLGRLLETDPGLAVVGNTSDPSRIVALVRETRPDILLFGLHTTGDHGIDALRELGGLDLTVRTILLIDRVDRDDVIAALHLGVRAVIPKDSSAEMLFKSIRGVMADEVSAGPDRIPAAVAGLQRLRTSRRRSQAFGLTQRETQILRAIVAGHTNKDIAEQSSISENTVKSHVVHLFNKLGASNRVELALFAVHHRLLDGV